MYKGSGTRLLQKMVAVLKEKTLVSEPDLADDDKTTHMLLRVGFDSPDELLPRTRLELSKVPDRLVGLLRLSLVPRANDISVPADSSSLGGNEARLVQRPRVRLVLVHRGDEREEGGRMRRRAVRGVRGGMGRGLERVLAQVRREVLFEDVLVRLVADPSARREDELVRTVAVGDRKSVV